MFNSSDGPSMPFGWSACAVTRASVAHQVGIDSPWAGQPLPITRATSACGFDSLRYLKCLFAMLKMPFSDV